MASGKSAGHPPIYTDNFNFPLVPRPALSKLQAARLRLFQGRVEHFKREINNADKFRDPNMINLLYLIGYSEKVRPYVLEHTCSNLVVLCVDVPPEEMAIADRWFETAARLCKRGFADENGTVNEKYFKYYANAIMFNSGSEKYQIEQARIAYESLRERFPKYLKRFIICDKLHPEKTIAAGDLNKIIKRYFPRGREELGCSDAAISPLRVPDAVRAGLRRENNCALLGFPRGTDLFAQFKVAIKRCLMDINTQIAERGCADMKAVVDGLREPPYGWSDDLQAGYSLGYALSWFAEDGYIFDGVASFPLKEYSIASACRDLLGDAFSHSRFLRDGVKCVLFTETGWRMVNRLSAMFGVEARLPIDRMLVSVRRKIEGTTRWPVALLDEKLHTVFTDYDWWHDKSELRAMIQYFDWERCERIHEQFTRIDEVARGAIAEKYPALAERTDRVRADCTGSASGWVMEAADFWGRVEMLANEGRGGEEVTG